MHEALNALHRTSSQLVGSDLGPGWISSSVGKNKKKNKNKNKHQPHEEDGSEDGVPEEVC